MIVYSDTRLNSNYLTPGYEFEVLNELKDLSTRSDDNCLKHTRFLFEFDEKPLKEQLELMKNELGEKCVRVVFSGSKSLHFITQFSDDCEEMCSKHYRRIWQFLEEKYFHGADSQCKNPARLTRTPNIPRSDTGRIQKLLLDKPDNYIDKVVPGILDSIERQIRSWQSGDSLRMMLDEEKKNLINSDHNGLCKKYSTVKRYLDTPFRKIRGNGVSSSWLFAAVCTCLKYRDQETLNEVLWKARREHWKESEIRHVMDSAMTRLK